MKLVVAYCNLLPETEEAVFSSIDELDEIDWGNTSYSDTAYFELIRKHWEVGETFVLLEQDKTPDQGALRELHNCPRDWCTYPVPMAHNGEPAPFVSLSCTKFSADLMAAMPNLMEQAKRLQPGLGRPAGHWDRLDAAMSGVLEARGAKPHWHPAGRVGHKHQTT